MQPDAWGERLEELSEIDNGEVERAAEIRERFPQLVPRPTPLGAKVSARRRARPAAGLSDPHERRGGEPVSDHAKRAELTARADVAAAAHAGVRFSIEILELLARLTRDAPNHELALAICLMAVDTAADSLRAVIGRQERFVQRRIFAKRDALRDLVRESIGLEGESDRRRPFRAERDPGAARPVAGAHAAPRAGGPG